MNSGKTVVSVATVRVQAELLSYTYMYTYHLSYTVVQVCQKCDTIDKNGAVDCSVSAGAQWDTAESADVSL